MDPQLIEAIGKLSVEVVAIGALTASLYMQAKSQRSQAKEMKKLSEAILESNGIEKENNKNIKEEMEAFRNEAKKQTDLMEEHQKWVEQEIQYFKKQHA